MYFEDKILMGKGEKQAWIFPQMANRHGLIAGATGTGKTVSLKVLAESLSDMGVPVFLADIKGDISGMCEPGEASDKVKERLTKLGVNPADFQFRACPVQFWDVYGEGGIPVRTTISEMGPMLLARLLELSPTQESVLSMVFRIADDNKLLLIDWKDLKAMVKHVSDNCREYSQEYGNITKQSIAVIQRELLAAENDGVDQFFGEPNLQISDWMQTVNGRGMVNVLHCVKLFQKPIAYSTFMLWLLATLFEELPEIGDPDKPKMVFFFDEAHLLFQNAPKVLLQKVDQVVKLIRSKGVGVYFITQNPQDIPNSVLAQLGNRIQHALRAYTPTEQKALRAAASSFRPNPAFDTQKTLTELGTGEALVSFLTDRGQPSIVERVKILPPGCSMDAADEHSRQRVIRGSSLYRKYAQSIDRQSAYEDLQQKEMENARAAAIAREHEAQQKERAQLEKERAQLEKEKAKLESSRSRGGSRRMTPVERMTSSAASSFGRIITNFLCRSLLGNLMKR